MSWPHAESPRGLWMSQPGAESPPAGADITLSRAGGTKRSINQPSAISLKPLPALLLIPRENLACPTLCPSGKARTREAASCRAAGAGAWVPSRGNPGPPGLSHRSTPTEPDATTASLPEAPPLELIPPRDPHAGRGHPGRAGLGHGPPVPSCTWTPPQPSSIAWIMAKPLPDSQLEAKPPSGALGILTAARSGPGSPAPPAPAGTRLHTRCRTLVPWLPAGTEGRTVAKPRPSPIARAVGAVSGCPGLAPRSRARSARLCLAPCPHGMLSKAPALSQQPPLQSWHVGTWHSSR